jgi:hypothetical protein
MNKTSTADGQGAVAAAPGTKDDSYVIPGKLMQAIVQTLGSLPWGQVNNLMAEVMNTVQAQEQSRTAS